MVIGMSRRDSRRKYKKRGKRKNQIFLVMMTILACTVAIVLTVKMNNKNVSKGVAVGAEYTAIKSDDKISDEMLKRWDGAEYTAIKSDGNVTEEQLSVSEETVNDLPDVYRIECYESLNQNPELPTGCEITSLTSVLNYYGCNVDKTTMSDEYLKKGNGSFYEMFLGNPRDNTSYGCMSQPIVNAANKYFKVNNMSAVAKNISGTDFKEILGMVAQGDPIVIWNTIDMRQPYESKTFVFNGKEYTWMSPEHCVVITGYDLNKNIVYIMDPMEGNITRNLETFQSRYEEMHSQAVYIIE